MGEFPQQRCLNKTLRGGKPETGKVYSGKDCKTAGFKPGMKEWGMIDRWICEEDVREQY